MKAYQYTVVFCLMLAARGWAGQQAVVVNAWGEEQQYLGELQVALIRAGVPATLQNDAPGALDTAGYRIKLRFGPVESRQDGSDIRVRSGNIEVGTRGSVVMQRQVAVIISDAWTATVIAQQKNGQWFVESWGQKNRVNTEVPRYSDLNAATRQAVNVVGQRAAQAILSGQVRPLPATIQPQPTPTAVPASSPAQANAPEAYPDHPLKMVGNSGARLAEKFSSPQPYAPKVGRVVLVVGGVAYTTPGYWGFEDDQRMITISWRSGDDHWATVEWSEAIHCWVATLK